MKDPESLKLLYSKPPKTWSDDYTIINLSAYTKIPQNVATQTIVIRYVVIKSKRIKLFMKAPGRSEAAMLKNSQNHDLMINDQCIHLSVYCYLNSTKSNERGYDWYLP